MFKVFMVIPQMTFKATLSWRKSACYACVAESMRPVFLLVLLSLFLWLVLEGERFNFTLVHLREFRSSNVVSTKDLFIVVQ